MTNGGARGNCEGNGGARANAGGARANCEGNGGARTYLGAMQRADQRRLWLGLPAETEPERIHAVDFAPSQFAARQGRPFFLGDCAIFELSIWADRIVLPCMPGCFLTVGSTTRYYNTSDGTCGDVGTTALFKRCCCKNCTAAAEFDAHRAAVVRAAEPDCDVERHFPYDPADGVHRPGTLYSWHIDPSAAFVPSADDCTGALL